MTPTTPPKITHPMAMSSVEKQRDVGIENLIFLSVYTNKCLLLRIYVYTQYVVRLHLTLLSLSVFFFMNNYHHY